MPFTRTFQVLVSSCDNRFRALPEATKMTAEEAIRQNALTAIGRFGSLSNLGSAFGYNRESVAWVEGFIEQQRRRRDITEHEVTDWVQLIGSYLGECVRHTYAGVWRIYDGEWGVFFNDSNAAFPFNKVRKQFSNGIADGESILSFFDVIGLAIIKKN